MRRYRSYLSLMARSTLYKELLLILGMAVVEGALFFYQSQKQITFLAAYTADREEVWMSRALTIGEMVENARLSLVWFGGLLLLSLLLIRTAGRWRDYTLNRLGLSRVQGNLLYGGYCAVSFVLLWGFQAALCLGMCLFYRQQLPAEMVTRQTILLSIYQVPLFSTLLPLANGLRWVTDVFVMAALGVCAAGGARLMRLGCRPLASIELLVVLFWLEHGRNDSFDLSMEAVHITVAFCFGAVAVARMILWDNEDGEEEPDVQIGPYV